MFNPKDLTKSMERKDAFTNRRESKPTNEHLCPTGWYRQLRQKEMREQRDLGTVPCGMERVIWEKIQSRFSVGGSGGVV